MTKINMKTVRKLNEKDLRSKILDNRTDLAKLRVDSSKGTLRKESGKLKPIRHNIARMLTRLNEMEKKKGELRITFPDMNLLD